MSRWRVVGSALHATLDVAAVSDGHWAASGFRAAPATTTLEVALVRDEDDDEVFVAAVALARMAA